MQCFQDYPGRSNTINLKVKILSILIFVMILFCTSNSNATCGKEISDYSTLIFQVKNHPKCAIEIDSAFKDCSGIIDDLHYFQIIKCFNKEYAKDELKDKIKQREYLKEILIWIKEE